ncbi:MAG: hypothetical protein Q4G10_08195 [Bacteroidia bacterium]|nr:hypothetical protein [Bacteroidia bacterium]
MIKAVVYTSETGHTKKYAELFGERTGLPVYDLDTAIKEVPKGAEIVYLGWLMAGTVKGGCGQNPGLIVTRRTKDVHR